MGEEALAPLADNFTARIQASGDLVVVDALGGHQDHLGANDFEVGQRISNRPAVQLCGLLDRQHNVKRALSCHIFTFCAGSSDTVMRGESAQLIYVNAFKQKPTRISARTQSENVPMTAWALACTMPTHARYAAT